MLALRDADVRWARDALAGLGLPGDAWFACVHVREPGYSPVDEELHAHRNGSIDAVIPAIRLITSRGGWVVRIGDPSMTSLPAMDRVIDYAHHPAKSDRLDVILGARARFVLGNTSGAALVSTVFGVPCALANMIPVATLGFGPRDICIPKILFSRDLQRVMTLKEIFESPVANFGWARLYANARIDAMENDAEDLRLLAGEMLERLDGLDESGEFETTRPEQFWQHVTPRHHCHGSCASVSGRYLERHPELL